MTAHGEFLNRREGQANAHEEAGWNAGNAAGAEANRHAEEMAKYAEAEAARKSQERLLGPKAPPNGERFLRDKDGNEIGFWDDAKGHYVLYGGGTAAAPRPTAPASLGSYREG
jgi:hypothetical protein